MPIRRAWRTRPSRSPTSLHARLENPSDRAERVWGRSRWIDPAPTPSSARRNSSPGPMRRVRISATKGGPRLIAPDARSASFAGPQAPACPTLRTRPECPPPDRRGGEVPGERSRSGGRPAIRRGARRASASGTSRIPTSCGGAPMRACPALAPRPPSSSLGGRPPISAPAARVVPPHSATTVPTARNGPSRRPIRSR